MSEEKKQEAKLAGVSPEVVGVTALERIEHATIDVQIATAHQYPRSMAIFKKRALEMVTLDEETAQSCIYRRPVGKKGNQTEYAEGKSIRMAEIVGACYGNLRVGAILIEQTPRYVKTRGMAHDLESNFASTSEIVESTVDRNGNPYSERMSIVVAKAALAKARRDATFQVVPGALCKAMEEAARKTAIGTTATLGKRRATMLDWLNKVGVEQGRVWQALGIKGIEDVGLVELETLTGIKTALKEGDVTLDEAFPAEIKKPVSRIFQTTAKIVEQAQAEKKAEAPPATEPQRSPPITPGLTANEESLRMDVIQAIRDALMEAHVSEGRFVTHLRKSGTLKQFGGLDDMPLVQAQPILKTMDVALTEIKEAKNAGA